MQDYGAYYANLLIWQYRDKPVAYNLIYNLISSTQIFYAYDEIGKAFNLSTAVGVQLRTIGTFIGIPATSDILALTDEQYRSLVYFKIIINNSNASQAAIVNGLFALFGAELVVTTDNLMHIFYFASLPNPVLEAAINNNLLPRPMGVGFQIIDALNSSISYCDSTDIANIIGIDSIGGSGIGAFIDTTTILT